MANLGNSSAVAIALACAAGCSQAADGGAAKDCSDVALIVAASDYTSSSVGGAPSAGTASLVSGLDLGQDPQLATSRGRAFLLARDNDVVFELDPSCGTPKARFSVHELAPVDPASGRTRPANPHDLAVAPDGALFVALYDAAKIAIVAGGTVTGSIDLSPYDADGNPQAESIRIVDVGGAPKAFVALERLDDHDFPKSKQPSQMLRVDVATRHVEAAIDLEGRDPFNVMSELDGALYLAEPGSFDADAEEKAGIERFDTATSTTRLLVSEAALGGSVSEVAVTGGCGAAIVAGPQKDVNPTSLVTFDPKTGDVLASAAAPVLGPTPGYDLEALAWRGGTLYVGDRRSGAGGYRVHAFERDGASCALRDTGRVIDLPQRPVALRPAL